MAGPGARLDREDAAESRGPGSTTIRFPRLGVPLSDTTRARRIAFAAVPVAAMAMLVPGIAVGSAVTTDAAASKMAGCLKGGTLTNVAVASKPAKKCAKGAVKVVWNRKGPKGDVGPAGATGPAGAAGAKGDKGTTGSQGVQGLVGPQGPAGPKGDAGVQGLQGLLGPQGPAGAAGLPGLAGLETITQVIPAGNPGDLGGVGNPISLACDTGQMAISGGVIPSAASLGALDSLLALPLGLLGAGALLDTVTSVLSVAPVSGGDTLELVTALPANPGDTFYALCATVAAAAG